LSAPTNPAHAQRGPRSADRTRRGAREKRGELPPDILYHATSRARVRRVFETGSLTVDGGRPVFLSRTEEQAWQVAHRGGGDPFVLVVDASRARRGGCRFSLNRQGLWLAPAIPLAHLLNLHPDYGEQVSAGGIPTWFGPDGPQVCLIRVARRHGATWEVAKGKLETGETPAQTAVREVQEEMGFHAELQVRLPLGAVRYGFLTPEGAPRLKTLHMYLMESAERFSDFQPADKEGVVDVGWFPPAEAERMVVHRSLRPLLRQVRELLDAGALREVQDPLAPAADR
jgi:8-oxo-dGTP pyrophosphatase MutT (NUDIX family)